MKSTPHQKGTQVVGLESDGSNNNNNNNSKSENWEMRPCGMLVQKRQEEGEGSVNADVPMIRINVSYSSSQLEVSVTSHSTFGEVKRIVAQKYSLEPAEQQLLFRGREQEDDEHLHLAGVKDGSKVVLLENPASKDKKLDQTKKMEVTSKEHTKKMEDMSKEQAKKTEETSKEQTKKMEEMSRASEAIAVVRSEVDKLSERIAALEVAVQGGTKVADKEFEISTELLMRQLLNLDGIDAEGESRVQRKAEVRRVQGFVDIVDGLKARNSNPFSSSSSAATVTTNWETFESGVGSLTAPPPRSLSTKVTQDWEQFD